MRIDSHQHLWVISEREYPWITPELSPLNKDFEPADFLRASESSMIDGTVLVQSADSYEDTFYMLDVAQNYHFVLGVVGWIPFDKPREAGAALEVFASNDIIKGFRNLTHDYSNLKYNSDDAWILRTEVLETLRLIALKNLSLDYVAVKGSHLTNIVSVAKRIPSLRIVIDHLGKPDIARGEIDEWSSIIGQASRLPNLYLKLSGLNTASNKNWRVSDWKPYFEVAYESFGSDRLLIGSDWPVIEIFDSYERVWKAQVELLDLLSEEEKEKILGLNAVNFYGLKERN